MSRELALIAELSKKLKELESLDLDILSPSAKPPGVQVITIDAGDTAFTTTGSQIIVCNNTGSLDITLNLTPGNPEHIIVIRRNGPVSLIGTLNGSSPTAIPSKNDILDVYYTTAAGEWSA
jgi:hypothetical protein